MKIEHERTRYVVAQALWEFIANERDKPSIRQRTSNMEDMEHILEEQFSDLLPLLKSGEQVKDQAPSSDTHGANGGDA